VCGQSSYLSPLAAKLKELPQPKVTVIVPTLAAGDALAECLSSLETQTYRDFEVVVVDNSASHLVTTASEGVRVITNQRNVGFGAAINQGYRTSTSPYIAALNDDAVAEPNWLARMVACADRDSKAGMFASEVRLTESGKLDSAGMLIAADGSSRQRGHGESPEIYKDQTEALFPSGSAALYRRKMLDEIGAFDEDFFLYCEDTDLGLRARWKGWICRYVPGAVVQHRYSHSAGRASIMKAYYVERNRICTAIKNFPLGMLVRAPFAAAARYFWHLVSMIEGKGKAAEFRDASHPAWLPFVVVRAHAAALMQLPRLLRERRRILSSATVNRKEFRDLLQRHSITVRKVANL
jgi:GT2 family glycosyltransferase